MSITVSSYLVVRTAPLALLFASFLGAQNPAILTPVAPATPKPVSPTPAPSRAKPTATPAPNLVNTVLRMVKLKLPEATILRSVQPLLKSQTLSSEDVIRLAEGGATPALIEALTATGGPTAPPNSASLPAAAMTSVAPVANPAEAVSKTTLAAIVSDFTTLPCDKPAVVRKRVIAVSEFDFGAQKSAEQALLQTQNAIGTGMTALAVKRVQETGKFRVVERKGLESVKVEQELGASSRAKSGAGARLGRIQGADAILMGTITVFGRDDRKKQVGGGGLAPGVFGALSFGSKEDKAVVAVSYRLVDAETSEVISSGEARGESLRKSKGLGLAGANAKGGAVGGFDMTSSNFQETIIGEATVDCMNKLITVLNGNEAKIRLRQPEIDTRVADITGKQIYISSGSADGVQKCDRFEVSRVVKEVKDPLTKEVLDLQLEKVGEIMITEVRDKMAVGAFQGDKVPEVGMAVRRILQPEALPDKEAVKPVDVNPGSPTSEKP